MLKCWLGARHLYHSFSSPFGYHLLLCSASFFFFVVVFVDCVNYGLKLRKIHRATRCSLLGIIWWMHHKELSVSDWTPGAGSTLSRGRFISAPELSRSVALSAPLKRCWTSKALIVHSIQECRWGTGRRMQTKPNKPNIGIPFSARLSHTIY